MTQSGAGEELRYRLKQLLYTMVEKGASDIHLTAASAPVLRIDGHMIPLKLPPLKPEQVKQLVYEEISEEQKIKFERSNNLDFSLGVPGLSRFRGNLFMQRGSIGAVFRQIPFKIRAFEDLGLPPIVRELAHKARGLVLVTGATGSGKSTTLATIIDLIQHRAALPHPYHRRPDRVRAPAQDVRREPARGRERLRQLQGGAQVRAPTRPRRRAHRRNARSGDRRGCAHHRRDGPSRVRHTSHQHGGDHHQPHHRRVPAAPATTGARTALDDAARRALAAAAFRAPTTMGG